MVNKKVLLVTVGGQGGFKTICDEKPDLVYFLQTPKSKDTVDTIISDLQNENYLKEYFKDYENLDSFVDSVISYANDFKDKINRIDIEDHEKITETFVKSRSVIIELKKEDSDVLIDFTGGAKPMAIGLYLAAMGEGCQYAYVSGERVDDIGVVKAGFEQVTNQIDPFQYYAIDEFNRGIDFFNQYQFDAARINFEEANSKLIDSNLKERAKLFISIVNFYDSWDKFSNNVVDKVNKKVTSLDKYLDEEIINVIDNNDNLFKYFKEENSDFYLQLKRNRSFLKLKLSENDETIKKDIEYYLPDLLNNAERRFEEGKYDDCVARLYRAIELVAQLNLNKYGVINEDILRKTKSFKVNGIILDKKLNKKSKEFLKNERVRLYSNSDEVRYDSSTSYKILSALVDGKNSDETTKDITDNYRFKIKDRIQSRNSSILAHGLNPINEKTAKDLLKMVNEHSNKLHSYDKYKEYAKFPKFLNK